MLYLLHVAFDKVTLAPNDYILFRVLKTTVWFLTHIMILATVKNMYKCFFVLLFLEMAIII